MEKLTNIQIDEIESRMNLVLPGLYRKLLVEEGFGEFGNDLYNKINTKKEIYHPEQVNVR